MTTVDKFFANNLKKNQGYFDGDDDNTMGDNPRCVEITEYDNAYGGKGYGLTFEDKPNKYVESEYVMNPRQYWKYESAK